MRKGQIYGLVLLAASAFTGMELQAQAAPGTLYVESNSAAGNTFLKFNRDGDGRLEPAGEFSTGGKGTGAGLGNAGALYLPADDRYLLAVNAGSNDISVLAVKEDGLALVD